MFRLILLLSMILPAFAGGRLILSIGTPGASGDPAAQGAIATARVSSCGGSSVSAAVWSVQAIGMVHGQRIVMPVRTVPLKKDLVAIHWDRPDEGDWQLRFTSHGRTVGIDVGDVPLRPQAHDMMAR